MTRFFTLLLVGLCLRVTLAQNAPVTLEARAADTKIKLGQSLRLTVQVTADPGVQLKLPAADSFTFEPWEVRDAVLTEQPSRGGQKQWLYTFRLAAWDIGQQKVPSVKLSYQLAGQTREAATEPIEVTVATPEPDPEGEIRDFHGADPLPIPWWVYAMATLCALVTLALFWIGVKAIRASLTRKQPEVPLGPVEWTLRELDKLGDLKDAPGYERFTQVLRTFLARKHQLPVLERTTSEVLSEMRERSFPPEQVQVVQSVLEEGDLVKFARQVPGDAGSRVESVRQMVKSSSEETQSRA